MSGRSDRWLKKLPGGRRALARKVGAEKGVVLEVREDI